eukprot:767580-Hanusia_phi.AAC.3
MMFAVAVQETCSINVDDTGRRAQLQLRVGGRGRGTSEEGGVRSDVLYQVLGSTSDRIGSWHPIGRDPPLVHLQLQRPSPPPGLS